MNLKLYLSRSFRIFFVLAFLITFSATPDVYADNRTKNATSFELLEKENVPSLVGPNSINVDGTNLDDLLVITASSGNSGTYQLTSGGNPGPLVNFSGIDQFSFNGLGGNDRLRIIHPSGSLFAPSLGIQYQGGGNTDDLEVISGSASLVTYSFANANDGTVTWDGCTLTYTGLEPVTSSITATNVTLDYSAASEIITITDAGGGQTTVDSTLGETVTFNNPTGTLTINAGDTNSDTINVASLAANYPAQIVIDGQGGSPDAININGNVSTNSKNISLLAENIATTTSLNAGTGDINITADTIALGASVTGTGNLAIISQTNTTTIGIGGGSGTMNVSDTELANLTDGFSTITIGNIASGTGTVDINTATFVDPVSIAGGTIHDGSGTDIFSIGNNVTLKGSISPGQSPGILTINGIFSFSDNSTFDVEIGGTSPGSNNNNHDQLDITGTVTTGNNVSLNTTSWLGFAPSNGDSFTIINNDASDPVSGTFSGLAEGATISNFLGSGLDATITYVGGDGNDAVISVSASPTVTSINRVDPNPTNATSVNFTVNFSTSVTDIETGDFVLATTGSAGGTINSVSSPIGSNVTVIVNGITGDGSLGLNFDYDALDSVLDSGGNPVSVDFTGQTYTIDNTAPQMSATNLASSFSIGPTNITLTFNEDAYDPPGQSGLIDDVTDLSNYIFAEEGTVAGFQSTACNNYDVVNDSVSLADSISYNNITFTTTLTFNTPVPAGSYRLFVCGTTSIVDLAMNPLNGGSDSTYNFTVQASASSLPSTGFRHGSVTALSNQPAVKAYTSTAMTLEIPKLGVSMPIVGVPQSGKSWDVTWLGNSAGYLAGSAFPTWAGNTVITGHVWDSFNQPGVFAEIKSLKYGDQVQIQAWGMIYTYEVRESKLVTKKNVDAAFQSEAYDWVTLVTCEFYNPFTGNYLFRRAVRAVLVNVK